MSQADVTGGELNFDIEDWSGNQDLLIRETATVREKQSLFLSDARLEYKIVTSESNGLKYEGQVIKNSSIKHGYGRLNFPDGSYYEGYWEQNKSEGRGAFRV
jgi:hypothetical protein